MSHLLNFGNFPTGDFSNSQAVDFESNVPPHVGPFGIWIFIKLQWMVAMFCAAAKSRRRTLQALPPSAVGGVKRVTALCGWMHDTYVNLYVLESYPVSERSLSLPFLRADLNSSG